MDGWSHLRQVPAARLLLGNRQQQPEEPDSGLRAVAYLLESGHHGGVQGIKEHFFEIEIGSVMPRLAPSPQIVGKPRRATA